MNRYCLPLLGLLAALSLTGCAAKAEEPSPAPEPAAPSLPVETFSPPSLALPLPTPSPTPFPEPEEGNYFDDALFVGDSILEGVRQYVAAQRQEGEMLGTARFLTTTMGISLADLVGDREVGVQFSYQGEERPLADIVGEIAPRRVFLLLGLNDLASDPDPVVEEVVNRYTRLILNLRSACPGVEFIVITNPPKVASRWLPDYTVNRGFGNELIGAFVDELRAVCPEWNIPYVDAYQALRDENGALPDDCCRDGFVHLSHRGAAAVVEALEAFAQGR